MPNKPDTFDLVDERDAVEALLQDKYNLGPDEARAMAQKLRRNGETTSTRGTTEDALTKRADIERERMERMKYYTDLVKRQAAGAALAPHEEAYLAQVKTAQANAMKVKAQAELQNQKMAPIRAQDMQMQDEIQRDRAGDDAFLAQNRPAASGGFLGDMMQRTRPQPRTQVVSTLRPEDEDRPDPETIWALLNSRN